MKIRNNCMALAFGIAYDYMPDHISSIELYTAMSATAKVLYSKPKAKQYQWLFLRSLIKQHKRGVELMLHYNHYYGKAYPNRT